MLHTLDHRLELRRHKATRLRRSYPKSVLETSRIQSVEATCGGGCGQGAEDDARVPTSGEHLQASERLTDPRPRLIAQDRAQQETSPGNSTDVRGGCKHGGYDQ
jgi:hypothetical protein